MNSNAEGIIKTPESVYNKNPGCLSNRDFLCPLESPNTLQLAKVGNLNSF